MIVPSAKEQLTVPVSEPSSTLPPPPAFEDITDDTRLLTDYSAPNISHEPPPEFTPYDAIYFDAGNGNIVSHDPHLNTDGEALYRFLLSQSQIPPKFTLHCRGIHTETRHRQVTHRGQDGRSHTRTESYTETITDFDFSLDVGQYLLGEVTQWTVADAEPAYRGSMTSEIQTFKGKRRARGKEKKSFKRWKKERYNTGLPPWAPNKQAPSPTWDDVIQAGHSDEAMLASSKTVREWADEYCSSPKYLKEFVYEKVVFGWKVRELENAVQQMIKGSLYQGSVTVEFRISANKIYVRPDNKLSRALSNKWIKLVSIVFLVYPFIWLFKRLHSRGGGSWEVAGGAYAMKKWIPVTDQEAHLSSSILVRTGDGRVNRLSGIREGEWLKKWQPTILRAVNHRYQSSTPLHDTTEDSSVTAIAVMDSLDSY